MAPSAQSADAPFVVRTTETAAFTASDLNRIACYGLKHCSALWHSVASGCVGGRLSAAGADVSDAQKAKAVKLLQQNCKDYWTRANAGARRAPFSLEFGVEPPDDAVPLVPSGSLRRAPRTEQATAQAEARAEEVAPETDLAVREALAEALGRGVDAVPRIKRSRNGLYDPVDGLVLVSGKDRNNAAEDLRAILLAYSDVNDNIVHVQFEVRGSRPDSKGCDLPTFVEIMMLSRSRAAAAVRRKAAEVLCRVLGGDVSLAERICQHRRVQEHLKESDPEHPARVFGEYAEQHPEDDEAARRLRKERLDRELEEERALRRDQELRFEGLENKKRRLDADQRLYEERYLADLAAARGAARLSAAKTTSEWLAFEKTVQQKVASGELTEEEAICVLRGPRERIFKPLGDILRALDPRFEACRKQPFAREALRLLREGFFAPKPQTDVIQMPRYEEIIWYQDDLQALFRFGLDLCDRASVARMEPGQQTLFGTSAEAVRAAQDRTIPPQDELLRRVAVSAA